MEILLGGYCNDVQTTPWLMESLEHGWPFFMSEESVKLEVGDLIG